MTSVFVPLKAIIPRTAAAAVEAAAVLPLSVCCHWRQQCWFGQSLSKLLSVCTLHDERKLFLFDNLDFSRSLGAEFVCSCSNQ